MDLTASREGIRAYARGRAYDPNRYPITPYRDPNERFRKKKPEEDPEHLTEEEKAILKENGIPIPEEKKETYEPAVERESSTEGEKTEDQSAETEETESKS